MSEFRNGLRGMHSCLRLLHSTSTSYSSYAVIRSYTQLASTSDVCVYRRRGDVDVFQSTPAEHSQDRSHLVLVQVGNNCTERIGNNSVMPSTSVRDLGIIHRLRRINEDLCMSPKSKIVPVLPVCFAVLRQIRSIRRSVSQQILRSLVTSLVLTRLDYGNATLAGLPNSQLDQQTPVSDECSRTASILGTEVRAHHTTAP